MIDVSQLSVMTQIDFGEIVYNGMKKFFDDPKNQKEYAEWLERREANA